ncbi:MAG: poly-gamma-glutamate biosynthesis protein PgsC [Bacilli bacterium]
MVINTIILGLIIAIIFFEITQISPGGLIVPGTLAMYFARWDWIMATVVIAIITYLIVKLLSKYLLIFGKRKFVLYIIISLVLSYLLSLVTSFFPISWANTSIVGYTIAGIIASNLDRQGITKTVSALGIVLLLTQLIVWGLALV